MHHFDPKTTNFNTDCRERFHIRRIKCTEIHGINFCTPVSAKELVTKVHADLGNDKVTGDQKAPVRVKCVKEMRYAV